MSRFITENPHPPEPVELAAFVDGELKPERARQVVDWLSQHPDAAKEVEAILRLGNVWQAGAPLEPSHDLWQKILARIESTLRSEPSPQRKSPGLLRRAALGVAAAAAAAALIFALWQRPSPVTPPAPLADEPFAILSDDEVTIISMDDDDRGALIVGKPPVEDALALLLPNEVTIERVEQDDDGMKPSVMGDDIPLDHPMIVAPLRATPIRDP